MPDFKVHSESGIIAGYIAGSLSLYFLNNSSLYLSGLIFFSAYSGAIFPDIDSDNSTTINIVFNILAIVTSFMAITMLFDTHTQYYSYLIPPGIYLFTKFGIARVFKYFSKHRGIYHSVPMAFLLSLIIFHLLNFKFNSNINFVIAAAFFSGYLIHLILDEINSIYDMKKSKIDIKKSLGTAFSFKGFDIYSTAIVYFAAFILFCINFDKIIKGVKFISKLSI